MKKNLKSIYTIVLCGALVVGATACQKKEITQESVKETITTSTTASSEAGTESYSEETAAGETKPYFETSTVESAEVPDRVKAMQPILLGLCKGLASGQTYDASNAEFFWNCIYASINGSTSLHPDITLTEDGSGYLVPKEVMAEYAIAMFAGENALPDIPSSIGGIEFNVDADAYVIYSSEGYMGSMYYKNYEETANGCTVQIDFVTKNGTTETHVFSMINNETNVFPYAVDGIVEE